MIKIKPLIILIILLLILPFKVAFASSGADIIDDQLSSFDFTEIDKTMGESEKAVNISFSELISKAAKGELSLSPTELLKWIARSFLREVYECGYLMAQLIVIALLSAVIKALTDSFKTKSIGEMGFYVCYAALVAVLLSSMKISVDTMSAVIGNMAMLMQSALPLMTGLLIMAGDVACAVALEPLVLISINAVTMLLNKLIVPLTVSAAAIQTVNYLTEKETLGKLSELIRKGCVFALTVSATLFGVVLTVAKISAPIINNFALKTARSAGSAVPVVGGFLTSAVDTVLYWAAAVKSAALVSVVIAIVLICGAPIIKMLAMVVIYKFTAAVIEPVCDKRIVKCIDSIGTYTLLFTGAVTVVSVMFVFCAVIVLSFGNGG